MDLNSAAIKLEPFLKNGANLDFSKAVPRCLNLKATPSIKANARYFDTPEWTSQYLRYCHRDEAFKARWTAAVGSLDGKVVVDIGCGPGNVFATLGGKPKALIGVDVSAGALEIARKAGYEPLVADAHDLPLASGIADIVIVNATIHHCDDMAGVLREAARLVAPGGILVTDHDPQLGAWNFKGPGLWLWKLRLHIYAWTKKGFHRSPTEQACALASEIHHRPGDGVTREFFESVLIPFGFKVELYPHNHLAGIDALSHHGRAKFKYRIGQLLSGINPNSPDAALSLMCRASRA
ncbi:MAG TPA: class I SAM-dependent methyltransferase [Beijerinckia sp.]|jgi:SAM-dependent methyltransferase|nr:class I SAM-dependent methyltransferase [Beijerinckia sp.]